MGRSGNPTGKGGVKFKPGVSGNPSGKPKADPEIVKFKATSYKDFINHLQKYGSFSKPAMEAEVKRTDITMFELMFANIVHSAAKGEKDARQVLLDRLWGKVREVVEDDKQSAVREQLSNLTTEELLKIVKEHKADK